MGRQTKKQRERKAGVKRTVTTPDGSQVQAGPRQSKMPKAAKQGVRPPTQHVLRSGPTGTPAGSSNPLEALLKAFSRGASGVTPEAKAAASHRMARVLDMLNLKPTPILEQFSQIGLPYTIHKNVQGDSRYDTVVILVSDLEAADRRIASRGTLQEQIWEEAGNAMHDRAMP